MVSDQSLSSQTGLQGSAETSQTGWEGPKPVSPQPVQSHGSGKETSLAGQGGSSSRVEEGKSIAMATDTQDQESTDTVSNMSQEATVSQDGSVSITKVTESKESATPTKLASKANPPPSTSPTPSTPSEPKVRKGRREGEKEGGREGKGRERKRRGGGAKEEERRMRWGGRREGG